MATVAGRLTGVRTNATPAAVIFDMCNGAAPVFVMPRACEAEAPTSVLPKLRTDVLTRIPGAGAVVTVRRTAALVALPTVLLTMMRNVAPLSALVNIGVV
jgi:hypothetical protein